MMLGIVSFATQPMAGSEPGAGWAFVRALAELAKSSGVDCFAIVRGCDRPAVVRELKRLGLGRMRVIGVGGTKLVPRTRMRYLLWSPVAAIALRKACKGSRDVRVIQVTFATLMLPPVFVPKGIRRHVWGPVSISTRPASVVGLTEQSARKLDLRFRVNAVVGRANIRMACRTGLVIAQNRHTAAFIAQCGRDVATEPNVVAERVSDDCLGARARTDVLMAGRLVSFKRPQLAVLALAHEECRGVTLHVAGSGPLGQSLRRVASEAGVSDRVVFHGNVDRHQLSLMMRSVSALVHPSSREGASWTIGEALANGLRPVFFTDSGIGGMVDKVGIEVQVEDGVDAWEASGRLACAIKSALALPPPNPSSRFRAARLEALLADWLLVDAA
jgi:hypothetical protein